MSINQGVILAHDRVNSKDVFARYGYIIFEHPQRSLFYDLKEEFTNYLSDSIKKFSNVKQTLDCLENYHSFVLNNDINHHKYIKTSGRKINDHLLHSGYMKILIEQCEDHFGSNMSIFRDLGEFRVSRPDENDFSPFHRDHWFGYFTPLLNLYIPLAGSWCDSAMQIVPKSHLWTEEQAVPSFGAGEGKTEKDGVSFSVPTLKYCEFELKQHCPDIHEGNFMAFSPKLIHGNAENNSIETRFSLEIRLEFN
jgi:hypothetical protein